MTRPLPRAAGPRLFVFVPARRDWPAAGRGTLPATLALDYVLVDGAGRAASGRAEAANLPRARAVDLVFDPLDVYSAVVDAPRLPAAKLRLALPNLLEERLLVDAADCHFAWAPTDGEADAADGGRRVRVAAIDRTTLARALEACAASQVRVRAAYSALHTLPPPRDGRCAARVAGARVLLRLGPEEGCSIDLDAGAEAPLALAREHAGLRALRVYGASSERLEELARSLGLECSAAGLPLDAQATRDALDLLQGAYASGGGFGALGGIASRVLRSGAWRAPAGWALACAVLAVAGLNAYWFKLDAQYQDLRNGMRHAFRDAFPAETTVVDELVQARRAVTALRARAGRASADDFSVLNAQAAQLFAAAPMGAIDAVEYADGVLRLHARPGSLDDGAVRNGVEGRAMGQGLKVQFGADGYIVVVPAEAREPGS